MAGARLTLQDLVILGMLSDQPRHGYDLHLALESEGVRDWADLSRPQIYYCLRKLERASLVSGRGGTPSGGPERVVYAVTARGRRALVESLARDQWARATAVPPFLTWMALSRWTGRAAAGRLLRERECVLREELDRRRAALARIDERAAKEALRLRIAQLRVELRHVQRAAGR